MYKFRYFLFTGLLLISRNALWAQPIRFVEDQSVKVYDAQSNEKTIPWCGGFNNPQFCMGDLNNDHIPDLIVYERSTGQVKTFINTGTPGSPKYIYQPLYARNFPRLLEYLKIEDYNRDGIPDLFHRGFAGIAAYKGYYNSSNQLCFTFYKDLFFPGHFGMVNAYTEPTDIPSFVDVDKDGDLDFFAYSVFGTMINFYKNLQVENRLPADSIVLCLQEQCWGKVYQGYERASQLGIVCFEDDVTCPTSGRQPMPAENTQPNALSTAHRTTLHTGNALCLLDMDADGDMDILGGNVSFPDIQLLTNGKAQNQGIDSMVAQDSVWQTNGHHLEMTQWPGAFWLDIDQNGQKDILISPHAENVSENYNCIAFYKNTGTTTAPVYTYQSDTFLIDQTIDIGTAATPFLYDYDRDGQPDLFISSDGYFQTNSGTLLSKIAYYKNTGTPGNPSFTFVTNDFLNISAAGFAGNTIAIGDLDNDGKDDLVLGHNNGTLSFYKNTAATAASQPVWVLGNAAMENSNGQTINVQGFAAPLIYDLNEDGKKDLIIGYQNGYLYYYQNAGMTNTLKLQYITNQLGGVKTAPTDIFSGFSVPAIGQLDSTMDEYLLLGSSNGWLYRYTGFQGGNVTGNYQLLDSIYAHIQLGQRAAPTLGDVDGDGKNEMIVGNLLGGVHFFKVGPDLGIAETTTTAAGTGQCLVYPNPARNELFVSWEPAFNRHSAVQVQLLSLTGQTLLQQSAAMGSNRLVLPLQGLSSGIYFCKVWSGSKSYVQRVVILK
jgi:hypothetical protein